jgi:RNA polymerase sigma-70 factor, ECF subfamily
MNLCAGDANILMTAPRSDDPDHAARLVERYAERLYRLAFSITGVKDDAEEAVQDALRTALQTPHVLVDDSAFGPWIYRAVGRAAHRKRTRRRVGAAGLDDVLPAFDADGHFQRMVDWSNRIDEPALQEGLQPILAEAIDALPADYRTALILSDVEGVSKTDIAEILGVDVPTVSSSVHRARLFVRMRLSEFFESGKPGLPDQVNRSQGAEHPIA